MRAPNRCCDTCTLRFIERVHMSRNDPEIHVNPSMRKRLRCWHICQFLQSGDEQCRGRINTAPEK